MRTGLSLCALSLILLSCARVAPRVEPQPTEPAFSPIALTDTLPTDPAVVTGTLSNGLTYFIRPNAKPERRAELRLAVNAGSVLEDDDQLGLAHFVEHMAFNGTAHFAKHELTDFLESIGMRFGPDLNAYTSFDETVYMLQVPTDSAELVDKAFLILRDWASGMLLEDEEIDKERGVILEEWRLGRGAEARIDDKHHPVVYHGSKYGRRLPIGDPKVIESFPHETLRRFYRDWYRPDLMAVVAVGDVDAAQFRTLIERHFGDLPRHEASRERALFQVPDHDSLLCVVATDKEATRTQVSLYYKGERMPVLTGVDYRRRLEESLYNGMLNQRLEERTKEADPPFVWAFSGNWPIARTKDSYNLVASVRDGGLHRGLEALLGEVARAQRDGFTDTEFERQKRIVLRGAERAYAERDKTESGRLVWSYVGQFLRQEPSPGPEFAYAFHQQYLPSITLEEVNDLSRRWFKGSRVVTVGAPESPEAPLPSEQEIVAFIGEAEQRGLDTYADSLPSVELLAELPRPGSVMVERTLDAVGAVEWTLSNDIRVILKPTDFKNDEILFSAFSPGGHSLVPDSLIVPATTACEVVNECGVGGFTSIQLRKALAGTLVNVRPSLSDAFEGFNGSCSPRDIEKALQLIHLYFTAPRSDSGAFLAYRARNEEYVKRRSSEPREVFQDTLSVTLNQHDARQRPWTLELLDELDLDRSLDVYRDRFADASDFTFVFVGAIDLQRIRPMVETYLASLPDRDRVEAWRDVGPTRPAGVVARDLRRGVEKKSQVAMVFPSEIAWSQETVHRVRSMATALQIRLRERIREDMSGTYGIGLWPMINRFPREECLAWVSFGCDPDRVDELVDAVLNEIEEMKVSGPDSLLMTKVKEGQRRQFEKDLKENRFWQSALHNAYLNDQPVDEILDYPELTESLTADDIRQAAVAHLDFDRYVKVVLYPAQDAEEPSAP